MPCTAFLKARNGHSPEAKSTSGLLTFLPWCPPPRPRGWIKPKPTTSRVWTRKSHSESKTERRSWGPMIESFLTDRVGLRAVVVIMDIRRGPEDDDAQLLEFLAHIGVPAILVATKLDKLPANKRKPELAKLKGVLGQKPVGFSAVTGDGVDALWTRILYAASILGPTLEGAPREDEPQRDA